MNYQTVCNIVCAILGVLWVWIAPTIPFALLCLFAIVVDCISAWRLNRRVMKLYGSEACDGKLKSSHMTKMFGDLMMAYGVMLIAQGLDQFVLAGVTLYLGNYVGAVFCLVQIVSILENESSCTDASWARVLQKVLADKTRRHLNFDVIRLKRQAEEERAEEEHRIREQQELVEKNRERVAELEAQIADRDRRKQEAITRKRLATYRRNRKAKAREMAKAGKKEKKA